MGTEAKMSTSLNRTYGGGGVSRPMTAMPFNVSFINNTSRPDAFQGPTAPAGFYPTLMDQQQQRAFQQVFTVPQQALLFQQQVSTGSFASSLSNQYPRDMQPPPKVDRRRVDEYLSGNQTPSTVSQSSENDEDDAKTGRWTSKEHELFLTGYEKFGKDWKKISDFMGTRSNVQCRTHAQKFFKKRFASENKFDAVSDSESDNGSRGQGKRQRLLSEKVRIDPTPAQLKTKPSQSVSENSRTLHDKPVLPLNALVQASEQAMPLPSGFATTSSSSTQQSRMHFSNQLSLPFPGMNVMPPFSSSTSLGTFNGMSLASLPYISTGSVFNIPLVSLNGTSIPFTSQPGFMNTTRTLPSHLVSAPK